MPNLYSAKRGFGLARTGLAYGGGACGLYGWFWPGFKAEALFIPDNWGRVRLPHEVALVAL
jgi:hypothetical protein